MELEDIERIIAASSPETFNWVKKQDWYDDALRRMHAITERQMEDLTGFTGDRDLARRVTSDLVRRLSAYLSESGYSRIRYSTEYLLSSEK